MSDGLSIGVATADEHSAIGALTVMAYRPSGMPADNPYFEVLRDTATRARESVVLVARCNGTVAGSVSWCPEGTAMREVAHPGEGEFRTLAVHPQMQGRGIGRALVEECLRRGQESKLTALVLSSAQWMTRAHRLYETLGFIRVPERDWRPHPDVPLLVYRLALDVP